MNKSFWGIVVILYFISFRILAFDLHEIKAGYYADQEITKSEVILFNPELTRRIEKVGQKILVGVTEHYPNIQNLKFTYRVINTPEINASATAGGFLYIHTGLLDILDSEDELAAVMAHEMAHSIENHYIHKIETYDLALKILGAVTFVGATALGNYASHQVSKFNVSPYTVGNVGFIGGVAGAYATAFAGGIILSELSEGYSQGQELEADQLGANFLKNSGYNPRAYIALFKKFKYLRAKGNTFRHPGRGSHLLDAKPGLQKRIDNIEDYLKLWNKGAR